MSNGDNKMIAQQAAWEHRDLHEYIRDADDPANFDPHQWVIDAMERASAAALREVARLTHLCDVTMLDKVRTLTAERDSARAATEAAIRGQELLKAGHCTGTIRDGFVACGEGGNYCSAACQWKAERDAAIARLDALARVAESYRAENEQLIAEAVDHNTGARELTIENTTEAIAQWLSTQGTAMQLAPANVIEDLRANAWRKP